MIMRWPGRIAAGSVCDRLVHLPDLAHTFVDLLGLPAMPYPHGVSLAPLLRDPKRSWRDAIFSPWYGQQFPMMQRMVITERHKYVFNGFDFDECYDLQEDPDEMKNLVNDQNRAREVDDMRARLYEMMKQYKDPLYGPPMERYLPRGKRA
jgi:arylsulfatase A-like enzyme